MGQPHAVRAVPLQIFSERVYKRCLPLGQINLLVPNPEWLLPKWLPLLPRFDAVLCKTHHAERIFRSLGCATRFIGFTSPDRHDPRVFRQRAFFHLAGRSTARARASCWTPGSSIRSGRC